MKRKTGISRSESKFEKYVDWLKRGEVDYIVLDWEANNFEKIEQCSSLLLTGGADVFPEFYADWEDGKDRSKYNAERDGFEFRLVDYALKNNLPLLGICRGLQLMNCRLNGSLINDIETIRGTNHRKLDDGSDRLHDVRIIDGSLMKEVAGLENGVINSSHHQAADRVGEGLRVTAKAPDGIIEAFEWADRDSKPFMLCVQWHPERLIGGTSEFAVNILKRFKEETERN